jgi:hypothetical protein
MIGDNIHNIKDGIHCFTASSIIHNSNTYTVLRDVETTGSISYGITTMPPYF